MLLSTCVFCKKHSQKLASLQAFKLPADRIFCETARRLAKKQDYSNIRLLLQSVQKSQRLPRSLSPDALNDEIIMSAIKVLASQSREVGGFVWH